MRIHLNVTTAAKQFRRPRLKQGRLKLVIFEPLRVNVA